MNFDWEEDEDRAAEEEMEAEDSCDYGVSDPCCDPKTKSMGLCTTESSLLEELSCLNSIGRK